MTEPHDSNDAAHARPPHDDGTTHERADGAGAGTTGGAGPTDGAGPGAVAPEPAAPAAANDPALPPELFTLILKRLVLFLLVVAVGSIGIGVAVGGMRGLWGALLGTGLATVFAVTTVVAVRAAARRPMDLMVIAVMGSWLLKTVLAILVLLAVRDADFFHRGVLFGAAAVAVLGSVLIDSQAVMAARIPYTRPTQQR